MNDDRLVAFGGEIKALGDGRIGGYLVRFTSPDEPDLEGDYFDASTYFGESKSLPLFYAHGFDADLGVKRIGLGTIETKDAGLWFEAQLAVAEEYEKAIMDLVKAGKLGYSSGAAAHLVEREKIGKAWHIKQWLLAEGSLTPAPADPKTKQTVVSIKSLMAQLHADTQEASEKTVSAPVEDAAVTPKQPLGAGDVLDEIPKTEEAVKTAPHTNQNENPMADEPKGTQVQAVPEIDYAKLAAAMSAQSAKDEETKRVNKPAPEFEKPSANVADMSDLWKYDHYSAADLGFAIEGVEAFKRANRWRGRDSNLLRAALAVRTLDEYERKSDNSDIRRTVAAMKMARIPVSQRDAYEAIKANELHYSTQAGAADEWVGTSYSGEMWEKIRYGSPVVQRIPTREIPQGAESITIPTATGSVTYYLIAQGASADANPGMPAETITSSKLTSAQKVLSASKVGAAAIYTGEMVEDSWLPFVSVVRDDMVMEGAEVLEHVLIDGDTATGATTNINDIAGTPGGTEAFLAVDGFRKLALVTNTGNSRDGGVLTAEDFLETVKLMGIAGRDAVNKKRVGFILPVPTHYKALELSEFKTRDVNAQATIENGMLINAWGYDVVVSPNMHRANLDATYGLKANSAGKVDLDTAANNITGSILAVRWDQWVMGYKRRLTFEAERFALADATALVATMRFGMTYRTTEASAISYNLTL